MLFGTVMTLLNTNVQTHCSSLLSVEYARLHECQTTPFFVVVVELFTYLLSFSDFFTPDVRRILKVYDHHKSSA